VYCRISSDPRLQQIGVERQRQDCEALAESLWPGAPVLVFVDNDRTAADPGVERPQWQGLLAAVRAGEVRHLVAYDQSRLTRQPLEWEQLLVVLAAQRISSVHTVREGERSVAEGEGRLMSRIVAAVDAEYVEVARARIKRALGQLAAEGRPSGGRYFGYRPAVGADGRRTREIVPDEAAAVRLAAERFVAGATFASIGREFEERHVPHAHHGKAWGPEQIRSLLSRPHIAGLRLNPHGELIQAIWEPILDLATWRRVQAILAAPAVLVRSDGALYRTRRVRRASRRYLLSCGLTVCGECGAPLRAEVLGARENRRGAKYVCDPRHGRGCVGIRDNRVEPLVVDAVLALCADPATRQALARVQDTAGVGAELRAVEGSLAELAGMWAAGRLSDVEWNAARPELLARADRLRGSLRASSLPHIADPATIREAWPAMSLAEQRAVLLTFLERIEVHRAVGAATPSGRVVLVWRPPFDQVAELGTAKIVVGAARHAHDERTAPVHQTDIADNIVELYQLGMSMVDVERRLGLPANTVARVLDARGVARHSSHGYVPERPQVVALRAAGASVATICSQLGLGKMTVYRVLTEEHIPPRVSHKLPWDDIINRYQAGQSTVRIARELGVSESGVQHVLLSSGIPRRRFGRAPEAQAH